MIERRYMDAYNEYLENSMSRNNFSVLECRIVDKVKKLNLSRDYYHYKRMSELENDLCDIIFYGLMALSAVCEKRFEQMIYGKHS